jgi:hypothetical protein
VSCFGIRRFAYHLLAAVCVLWTLAAPVAARILYPPQPRSAGKPAPRPHGAARIFFYCHLR